jgi:hypothetical protein
MPTQTLRSARQTGELGGQTRAAILPRRRAPRPTVIPSFIPSTAGLSGTVRGRSGTDRLSLGRWETMRDCLGAFGTDSSSAGSWVRNPGGAQDDPLAAEDRKDDAEKSWGRWNGRRRRRCRDGRRRRWCRDGCRWRWSRNGRRGSRNGRRRSRSRLGRGRGGTGRRRNVRWDRRGRRGDWIRNR